MAQRAAERWRALEAEAGVRLLHPTPQLTFGPGSGAVFSALEAAGAPAERISAGAIESEFPCLRREGGRGARAGLGGNRRRPYVGDVACTSPAPKCASRCA